jgi:hypothetical protein
VLLARAACLLLSMRGAKHGGAARAQRRRGQQIAAPTTAQTSSRTRDKAFAAAAAACGMSEKQLAKMEALEDRDAARLDLLLRTYNNTLRAAQRVPRAQRGECDARSCVLRRLGCYPRLLQVRPRECDPAAAGSAQCLARSQVGLTHLRRRQFRSCWRATGGARC